MEQVAELEHDLRALREGCFTPLRERTLRHGNRPVDLLDAGECYARRLLARRGIEDGSAAVGLTVLGLAADPVGDGLRHGARLLGLCGSQCLQVEIGQQGFSWAWVSH